MTGRIRLFFSYSLLKVREMFLCKINLKQGKDGMDEMGREFVWVWMAENNCNVSPVSLQEWMKVIAWNKLIFFPESYFCPWIRFPFLNYMNNFATLKPAQG